MSPVCQACGQALPLCPSVMELNGIVLRCGYLPDHDGWHQVDADGLRVLAANHSPSTFTPATLLRWRSVSHADVAAFAGRCDAKIRPLTDGTEIRCELVAEHLADVPTHRGVLRDYAYPGSTTTIEWDDGDRRTFRGEWSPCSYPRCILPGGHWGRHAR